MRCSRSSSARQAADVRKSIVEGAVITGRVASVREFGAFVELGGGIQGLLHVSEMAWARVSDTSQVVEAGRRDHRQGPARGQGQKISLGLKQLWPIRGRRLRETYAVGQLRTTVA